MLAISGQHVAILAAVIYFALGFFAVPASIRAAITLGLLEEIPGIGPETLEKIAPFATV